MIPTTSKLDMMGISHTLFLALISVLLLIPVIYSTCR